MGVWATADAAPQGDPTMPEQTQQPETTNAAPAGAAPAERPVWLVEHPTHQYNEDVKTLARQHGLQVVDAAAASADDIDRAVAIGPQLTRRGDVPAQVAHQPAAPAEGAKQPAAPAEGARQPAAPASAAGKAGKATNAPAK